MNRLSAETRKAVVAALSEGNSLHSTSRIAGVARNTVTKLLVDLGTVCSYHQDQTMRDLTCERIQADEIWAFVYAKQKNAKNVVDKSCEARIYSRPLSLRPTTLSLA